MLSYQYSWLDLLSNFEIACSSESLHRQLKIRLALSLSIQGCSSTQTRCTNQMKQERMREKWPENSYKGVSKSFQTDHLEWELQTVQLSATRCSCVAIFWVSLMSYATITPCVASQQVCVVVYFINSVWKLLDTPSYNSSTPTKGCWCGMKLAGVSMTITHFSGSSIPVGAENFSLHHHVQNGPGAHPVSYPVGTRGTFPVGKVARPWNWLLISI
jgi:hypothetical protein